MRHLSTLLILLSINMSGIAQSVGVNLPAGTAANTMLDVNGSVSFREGTALTCVNGVNSDIVLANYSFYRITGPTTAFDVTGFTNGSDGRMLIIVNASTQVMTLKNQTTSTAANQINTGSGADVLLPANGIASLVYNNTLQKWLLTAAEGSAPQKLGIGLASPTYPLDVTASTDPMRLQGLQSGVVADSLMTISAAGIVAKRSALNVFDDYVRVIFKTATESVTSSATLQDDDHLFFTAAANEKWEIEGYLDVDGSSGHIKYAMVIPSGTMLVDFIQEQGIGIGNMPHYILRTSGTATGQCTNDGTLNTTSTRFWGILNIGGTGGTVKLQWAQNASNGSATTVKINSFIKITRVQ